MTETTEPVTMDKIVSLSRRRGFVFPSSEIYGGLGSTYDYGHYGVLMKNNIRSLWFDSMVKERDDIVALDSAIILNPRVWEASGHVSGFTDPLVDCRTCKLRFRADHLDASQCGRRPSKRPGEHSECDLTEARQFNLMFQTHVGALEGEGSLAYLRPETAQGIFVNFKNVLQLARRKPPFGIAQVGKSFRNEITPGNFLFRMREFEQMEMEFFVPPDEAEQWFHYWVDARYRWYTDLGLRESHLRKREHDESERSHYSSATTDLEYLYPIGWSELEGIANRGEYDLTQHTEHSGHEARVRRPGRRALHAARDRAGGVDRPHPARVPRRRLRRGGRRGAAAHGAAPASARRAGEGGDPAADRQERGDGRAARAASTRSCGSDKTSSTTTAARSAGATAARTRSARRSRSRSTSRRSRTRRSRCATATRSRRSACRSTAFARGSTTRSSAPGSRRSRSKALAPGEGGPAWPKP